MASSTSQSNRAAYLTSAKARPLEIKETSMPQPLENQILIRVAAIAINPIDTKLQLLAFYPLPYPYILGIDVAGTITSVSSGISPAKFNIGDRVIGCAAGFYSKRDAEGGFQEFMCLESNLACKIPDSMSWERGVVMPLGVSTASAGLFQGDFLGLELPEAGTVGGERDGEGRGKKGAVLVWGAGSTVGGNTAQLARAGGYEVAATAGEGSLERVRGLGADSVVDYCDEKVVERVVDVLRGKELVGVYDAIGGGKVWETLFDIMTQLMEADDVKVIKPFIATVIPGYPEPPEGVQIKQVQALTIRLNEVGKAVWGVFLPKALEDGSYVSTPEPLVAGKGLASLQEAMDLWTKGVGSRKVVVMVE